MAIGAIAPVAGGLISAAAGAFMAAPDKVKIPPWYGINVEDVQRKTVAGNVAILPEASKFAASVNRFTSEQFRSMMELSLPGFAAQAQRTTMELMKGQLPKDVQESVLRSGAARMLAGFGTATGAGANLTLRDLGLTSLQAQQQGFGQYTQLAEMFRPQLFNVSSMFFDAGQRAQIAMWDAEMKWKRDLMAAEAKAQPSGTMAAIGNALMTGGSALMGAGISGAFSKSGGWGSDGGMMSSPKYLRSFDAGSFYEGANAPSTYGV